MTEKRYTILAMIFVSVVINHLDRSNISIAASTLKADPPGPGIYTGGYIDKQVVQNLGNPRLHKADESFTNWQVLIMLSD